MLSSVEASWAKASPRARAAIDTLCSSLIFNQLQIVLFS